MTKSKKAAKKVVEINNTSELMLRSIEQTLNEVIIPVKLQERFNPQIENVCKRIHKIADNLQKAITLEATKDEREAKKVERGNARRTKLEAQLAAIQEKLAKLS